MQQHNFEEIVDSICQADARFSPSAYSFVRAGLDHTLKQLKRQRSSLDKHVTGPELLEGLRQFTLEEFGPLGRLVLNHWGIHSCRDFGAIVFNLIEYNVLGRNESDTIDDFVDLYTFEEAFEKPFRPAIRGSSRSTARSRTTRKKSSSRTGKS